jgi:hypothetical protein
MHVRLFNFDQVELRCGIKFNGARVSFLPHDLLVNLAFRRHVNHQIALDFGLAGQTPIRLQAPDLVIALFNFTNAGDMRGGRGDAMLGKFTLTHIDLAAPANRTATTNRININAERTCSLQHRCSNGKPPALAGRSKDDQGICFSHEWQISLALMDWIT